ncbi:MAG: right-handed parallel beta-helix repeat-containing protein [Planctomycetes bacterium]|nr:right-handed parallel beta-helix repeat-containing protein [Planctomycetota bacterium]
MRATFIALAVLTTLAIFAPRSRAAVITVPSPSINTIQNGIDASSSGDVIRIKAGLYEETVTIGVNQGGITLVGVGKVILDARPFAIANGPGLEVLGSGVTVRNITIRCARTGAGGDGHGLYVAANDFTGTKINVKHCEADGIHIDGSGATLSNCRIEVVSGDGIHAENALGLLVSKCVLRSIGSNGIDALGNDVRVLGCAVRGSTGTGIVVTGANSLTSKCKVESGGTMGIAIDGSNSVLENCVTRRTFDSGLYFDGNSGVVRKCVVDTTFASALFLTGIDATVENNVFKNVRDGISISNVIDALVRGNRVIYSDARGFRAQNSSNVRVLDNVFTSTMYAAIRFETSSLCVASDNVMKTCALAAEAAIECVSNGAVLERNRIDGCGVDGIRLTADDVEVTDNILRNCGEDGIDVESGDACVLDGNLVLGCTGEGIENNGTNTTITNNVMKKNRVDLANDGTLDAVLGNVFTTGGTNEDPLIDF